MQQRLLFSFIYKKTHCLKLFIPGLKLSFEIGLLMALQIRGESDIKSFSQTYSTAEFTNSQMALNHLVVQPYRGSCWGWRACFWRRGTASISDGGEKERRRKELVSYLMVFPDSTQSCPHRHNRNEEFVLNDRLFRVWRLKNSRSHAGNHMSNTDNAAGEKPTKIVFSSVFTFHFGSAWVRVARLERWLQASFGSSCTNINKINEQ